MAGHKLLTAVPDVVTTNTGRLVALAMPRPCTPRHAHPQRALALHGSAAASAPTGWTLTRPPSNIPVPFPYYSVKQGINGGGGHDRNRASNPLIFAFSSSHSLSGLDASTMPAPAYKVTVSPLTTPDRMATTTVLLVVDKTPMGPAYHCRENGSICLMVSMAKPCGVPATAGVGCSAAMASNGPTVGRRFPLNVCIK